jgi:thiol-disulfide isomerase/thioredoxin
MKQVIMMTKDGCGSCTTFKPVAKQLAEEYGFEFKIIPNPTIELPFFPYFYIMEDGKVLQQWGGVQERKYKSVLKRTAKSK